MIDIFKAAWEFHQFFVKNEIPYVVIGGLAVQNWGEPRTTRYVDVTIAVPVEEAESTIRLITKHFSPRLQDHLAFALKNRILLARNLCEFARDR